jgi:hypothetical protein
MEGLGFQLSQETELETLTLDVVKTSEDTMGSKGN